MVKDSFIMRTKYQQQIGMLSTTQKAERIDAVFYWQSTWQIMENLDPLVAMLISLQIQEWIKDNENYEKVCEKNRENGLKWGRPKKNRTVISETQRNPTKPKKADNDYDSEYDNDNKKENILKEKKEKHLEFVKLTPSEFEKLKQNYWIKATNEFIARLNNYIWSKWDHYKSHYYTIINRMKKDWVIASQPTKTTLPQQTEPQWLLDTIKLRR